MVKQLFLYVLCLSCFTEDPTCDGDFRESEATLEDVTRSIKQSFSESSPPGCSSTEHAHHHLLSPSAAAAKPNLVEQIMTQMDQVFTELLKEDVGRWP